MGADRGWLQPIPAGKVGVWATTGPRRRPQLRLLLHLPTPATFVFRPHMFAPPPLPAPPRPSPPLPAPPRPSTPHHLTPTTSCRRQLLRDLLARHDTAAQRRGRFKSCCASLLLRAEHVRRWPAALYRYGGGRSWEAGWGL